MVYENTHLWAAERIRNRIENPAIAETIASRLDHYHLGAVFPDVLFYSKNPDVSRAAYYLHGDSGAPTNAFIFEVLDQIKNKPDENSLVFVWGYLTHCAMDMVFHPVVFYFAGYDPEDDRDRQLDTDYLHLHYETIIDRHFNEGDFLENMINPAVVRDLMIPALRNVSRRDIESCLKKQIFYFRLIHSRLYYRIFKVLAKMGLVDKRLVAGFYPNLEAETRKLAEKLIYRDIISGRDMEATLEDLMEDGINTAIKMVAAAHDYAAGKIGKESCKTAIAGHNLDTGRVDTTRKDIRFSSRS
jgi:hypothetical protein